MVDIRKHPFLTNFMGFHSFSFHLVSPNGKDILFGLHAYMRGKFVENAGFTSGRRRKLKVPNFLRASGFSEEESSNLHNSLLQRKL